MDIFSNREISIAIWLLLLALYCAKNKIFRESLKAAISAIFQKQILMTVFAMSIYTLLTVYIFLEISIWDSSQIKNTLFWFVFIAFPNVMKCNKTDNSNSYLKELILSNLKLLAIFEFVINFYSLSLLGELFFIPFSALLGGLLALAQREEKHKQVEKILNIVLFGVIVFMFVNAMTNIMGNSDSFTNEATLKDFYIPIALSFAFIPCLMIITLFMRYELLYIKIRNHTKDKELIKYALLRAMSKFRFNFKDLTEWSTKLVYFQLKSKDDINHTFKVYKR